jgi:SAM-dependent methyltransferase
MATVFDPSTYSAVDTFTDIYSAYEDAFDRVPLQVRSTEWLINQLPPDGKVLDVGCGTGKPVCEQLANAGLDVNGIDITPKMIEIATTQVPKAKFEVADARSWEPPNGMQFDGIISCFAFLAGVTQADIQGLFPRVYSWLRPGGVFVFGTVPMDLESVHIKWLGRDVVGSSLDIENCVSATKTAGFVIEKHELENYLPKGAEVGICKPEDVWEEQHLFVCCRKPQ